MKQKYKGPLHRDFLNAHILVMCSVLILGVFAFGISEYIRVALRSTQAPNNLAQTEHTKFSSQYSKSLIASAPFLYEPNVGQAGDEVDFLARKGSELYAISATQIASPSIAQRIVNANPAAEVKTEEKQISVTNYFVGSDASKWKTEIPNYAKISYVNIYKNIDVEYLSQDGQLMYQFVVQPGGDASKIELALTGAKSIKVSKNSIIAETESGQLNWEELQAYQIINGNNVPVEAAFRAKGKLGYGFTIGKYDTTQALYIDPQLSVNYSTYLGGSGTESVLEGFADAQGNHYVNGSTTTAVFPVLNAYQPVSAGSTEAWFAKFDISGTLLYSSFLGGTSTETAGNIVVDSSGNVYVSGSTGSADFPILNAFQPTYAGGARDWFLTKFNSAGDTLLFSTYIGGSVEESQRAMTIDANDNIYVFGDTLSSDFPMLNPVQGTVSGQDYAVVKLSSAGALLFGTYYGGAGTEFASSIIGVDASENVFVVGTTSVAGFPTVNAYQSAPIGTSDSAIAKIKTTAPTSAIFSTYFGLAGVSSGISDAHVDPSGNLYLIGASSAVTVPVTPDAFQSTPGGSADAYIIEFDPTGDLIYGTYLGGIGNEAINRMTQLADGRFVIAGRSDSATGMPAVTGEVQATITGAGDLYILVLDSTKSTVEAMTYFGGSANETLRSLVTSGNHIYIAGTAVSTDYPLLNPYQSTNTNANDPFVTAFTIASSGGGGGPIIDRSSPSITATSPANDAQNVQLNAAISVTFNEEMDPQTVNSNTFLVSQKGSAVDGTVTYLNQVATFTPKTSYAPNEVITVTITTEMQDTAGNSLSYTSGVPATPYKFSFKTKQADVLPEPEPEPTPTPTPTPTPVPTPGPSREELVRNMENLGLAVHDLVKVPQESGVWYLGADGMRHSFTNIKMYASWYCDFSQVKTIALETLEAIPLGQNAPYRPGFRMVKSPLNPKVYAIDTGWVLRPIYDEATAAAMYGILWSDKIDDVTELFYSDYSFGSELNATTSFSPVAKSQSVQYPSDAMNIPGYQPSLGTFNFSCSEPLAATSTEAPASFSVTKILNWLKSIIAR